MTNTLTKQDLADALDAFWNAGLNHCHRNRSDSATLDTIGAMAEGFSAVANALRADTSVKLLPDELLNYEAPKLTEAQHFMLEAALQANAAVLNDDATVYAYRIDDLVRLIECAMNRNFMPLFDATAEPTAWFDIALLPEKEMLVVAGSYNAKGEWCAEVASTAYLRENQKNIADGFFKGSEHLMWAHTHWSYLATPPKAGA